MKTRVKLGDVINTRKGFAFKSSWFKDDGDTAIAKVTNFTANSIDESGLVKISRELGDKYQSYRLNAGDVVIQTVGSWASNPNSVVGKCVRVPASVDGALLNQNAVIVSPKSEISQTYLYYLLKTDGFKGYIVGTAQGAASQAAITLDSLRAYEFELPALEDQNKISTTLQSYDELIENNSKRITKLKIIADLIYSNAARGKARTTSLEQKLPVKKGKNITKSTITPGNVPVVAGGLEPAYYHNTPNTQGPVITISASGANAGFVNIYHQSVWASDCTYIDVTATQNVYFYYVLLKNNQREITHLQKGSAQPHVYPTDLENLKIPDFTDDEIKHLSSKVSPIYELIAVLEQKNNSLSRTRDLLIPRLISQGVRT